MNRFDIIFQFTIGNAALTCLNLYVFNDSLLLALGISTAAWTAFWIGRAGGRFFTQLHSKMVK